MTGKERRLAKSHSSEDFNSLKMFTTVDPHGLKNSISTA